MLLQAFAAPLSCSATAAEIDVVFNGDDARQALRQFDTGVKTIQARDIGRESDLPVFGWMAQGSPTTEPFSLLADPSTRAWANRAI